MMLYVCMYVCMYVVMCCSSTYAEDATVWASLSLVTCVLSLNQNVFRSDISTAIHTYTKLSRIHTHIHKHARKMYHRLSIIALK